MKDWWGWTPLCVGAVLALAWHERRRQRRDYELDLSERVCQIEATLAGYRDFYPLPVAREEVPR